MTTECELNIIDRLGVPTEILVDICWFLALENGEWSERWESEWDCLCDMFIQQPRDPYDHRAECWDSQRYHAIVCQFWEPWRPGRAPSASLRNFRLVCRRFATIATRFTHEHISFELRERDLAMLEKIASHPDICGSVRSLEFHTMNLAVGDKVLYDCRRWNINPWEASRRQFSEDDLKAPPPVDYVAYSELYDEQQSCITQHDRDIACLNRVLPRLSNLRSLELAPSRHVGMSDNIKLHQFRTFIYNDGIRALETVLLAMENSTARLTNLRIDPLDWRFFRREPQELDRLASNLDQLQSFQLSLRVGSTVSEEDRQSVGLGECQAFLRTGAINRFIKPFDQLRSLLVKFPSDGEDLDINHNITVRGHLNDIVSPDRTWPHLRKLSLISIECTAEELMAFLRRHKDTLRELCLGGVFLHSPSWDAVLREIRRDLRLETACLCEDLAEIYPGVQRYWQLGLQGGTDKDECMGRWLRVTELNEYCCGRGNDEMPLHIEDAEDL